MINSQGVNFLNAGPRKRFQSTEEFDKAVYNALSSIKNEEKWNDNTPNTNLETESGQEYNIIIGHLLYEHLIFPPEYNGIKFPTLTRAGLEYLEDNAEKFAERKEKIVMDIEPA
jgi:hypothetical protein